jgi:hypothetical protein
MTAESTDRPRVPHGLATDGARLRRDVTAAYELRADELTVLEQACRTLDVLQRLDATMQNEPLTVRGSQAQLRERPLMSEARQQRAALARLLGQLHLPDERDTAGAASRRSMAARQMARAWWGVR